SNLVKSLPSKSFKIDHSCVACLKRKQHKASCKSKLGNYVSKPLHTLHMDLFGPTSISSLNHKWYCLVVTDDFSRFSWTFILKSKDETSRILRNFITEIENLKDLNVKIIRSDNEGEFRKKEMDKLCSEKGIKREFSNARTPQQNGVAKRRNKTLTEAARTMLADAKLSVTFWAEAVNTACYVQNEILVIKPHNKTPYELFNEKSPTIGFLRPFGCHVKILNTLDHLGKFDTKRDEGYFVGYSLSSKAFRVFNKITKKIEEDLHMDFLENRSIEKGIGPNCLSVPLITSSVLRIILKEGSSFPKPLSLGNAMSFENRLEDFFGDTSDASQIIGHVDTSVQTRQKTKNVDEQSFIDTIHQKTNPNLLQYYLIPCFLSQEEPKKIVDAHKDPSYVKAMKQELLQFKIQNDWVLVDHPKGVRPIGTKWEEGINYEEVFAPVVRIEAIRLFLAYASYMGFTVYQMDVKSAFLYGTIDEEVYVMQPYGFQDLEFPHRVYKVEKAMYGLHQALRAWCDTLSKYLLDNGFQRGTIDQTLIIRKHKGEFFLVQVYVDDIIFGSSNLKLCREFEALMHGEFQMSAMGELNFFIGLQVL
nr:hypothetical protein [Tanacetum cinerariifolium]